MRVTRRGECRRAARVMEDTAHAGHYVTSLEVLARKTECYLLVAGGRVEVQLARRGTRPKPPIADGGDIEVACECSGEAGGDVASFFCDGVESPWP